MKYKTPIDIYDEKKVFLSLNEIRDTLVVRIKQTELSDSNEMEILEKLLSEGEVLHHCTERKVYIVKFKDEMLCREICTRFNDLKIVEFAGICLTDSQSNKPVIYTQNLFIKLSDSLSPDECLAFLQQKNLIIKEPVDFIKNGFFVCHAEIKDKSLFSLSSLLNDEDDIDLCYPEILNLKTYSVIHDNQWHLKKTRIKYEADIDASANVAAAHEVSTGKNTIIAIIDDGVDIDHPEFSGKIVAERNFSKGKPNNPLPRHGHNHGTCCAGIACAAGKFGASGVAPDARLMPIRQAEELGSFQEAKAIVWAVTHGADVISCSWGPLDSCWADREKDPSARKVAPLPMTTRMALEYATKQGRGGKGCIVVFAAGNGNESVDNDMYASNSNVIAVAACNERSTRCIYSDFGKAVFCCFPSGDVYDFYLNPFIPETKGVWTTDVRKQPRYNSGGLEGGDAFGNYTNRFSGTSASCPGVAGVIALMLSVKPALTAAEVTEIIRLSSDKIDRFGGKYDKNGHSIYYGFGRINARAAVEMAVNWQTVTSASITSA